ncbi:MAG: FAD:protein FMN transferase [Hyphomicrobiaceae bacterium]|nr:FAD:protein FMN transferase [Hyphomicrobiaceae bacterium]
MKLSRRQFIVTAIGAGVASAGAALVATGDARPAFQWRGAALGGEARVALYGADADAARSALSDVAAEIERLEAVFSLHREASELSRLNRDGVLDHPSRDLADVLAASVAWRARTHGAFDPTIQPLWQAAADGLPASRDLIDRVGGTIEISSSRIGLPAGTALTLNGIAQGRIADRVTEVLVRHGFSDVVIDAGELRLPGKERRVVGIPAAKAAVSVAEIAIATSEPKSLVFDRKSFRHHLIDPRTGASPRHWLSLSVFAPTAEMADALSTGFALLPHDAVADLASSIGDVAVLGEDGSGRIRRLGNLRLAGFEGARS